MSDESFKNFGIMIPTHAINVLNDCFVFRATAEEFELFKEWVGKNISQLNANGIRLDIWINKDWSIVITSKSLTEWFDYWKDIPKMSYSVTSFKIG